MSGRSGAAEHAVRRVAEVVEHLDLSGFCLPIKAREGVAGRDATDPKLLVALWLYACVRGIGSARELARQCQENAAFRWLCGGVSVNHRLLSDFRTDHGEALDGLFTQVIASLVEKGVVRVSRISQDGVRVRVGAGSEQFSAGGALGGTAGGGGAARGGVAAATGVAGSREPALRRGKRRRGSGRRARGRNGCSRRLRNCRN